MRQNIIFQYLIIVIAIVAMPGMVYSQSDSIPSVVVTVENASPSRGGFLTPVWVGIHDGTFDIYNRDQVLGGEGLVEAEAVERLAEDGDTEPISDQFSITVPGAPQTTLPGPSGPLAPGEKASFTFNIVPGKDLYFSYASMVIPSNDAFIANGNPVAHELFNKRGGFFGRDFSVTGANVLDAGTEDNDEIAANTAFLNQTGPNIGTTENNPVILHPGLLPQGTLSYPDGVLNHPALANADFLAPDYRMANFSFRYVDLGRRNKFRSSLDPNQEVTANRVQSRGWGFAAATSSGSNKVILKIVFSGLTGPPVQAHLHNGAVGSNGPVVVDFSDKIGGRGFIRTSVRPADVIGPLAETENPMLSLLNQMAAGNIYINIHTEANPGGEIRGQLILR